MNKALFILPLMGLSIAAAAEDAKPRDWTNAIQDALTVYKSDTTFVRKVKLSWMEQYQMSVTQPNGSNGLHIKNHGSPFNQEFRRSWVGGNVDFATGTTFHVWGRIGGLPYREAYTYDTHTHAYHTRKNYSYGDLFDLWVKQDIKRVKGLSVKGGKIKPLFTTDYSTPSSQIMCTERSLVGNQHALDSNWGVEVNYAPNKQDNVYVQLMFNDRASAAKTNKDAYRDGRGLKGEFGWEDKFFAIVGANHKYAENEHGYQKVSAQYMHDFDNTYTTAVRKGNNYYGANVKDALSLGYEVKRDRLTLQNNLVFNFEMIDADRSRGNGNNVGLQVQPVYSLCPHADLVLRYVGMTGHGACKVGADRYVTTETTAPSWADSAHTFYVGLDLYASAVNKNALKMMMGAEYMTARKNGSDCYNGWEYTTAFRWNF